MADYFKDWADKTLRHHLEMAQELAAGQTVGIRKGMSQ